jgi:hypothetical protein
LFKSTTIDQLSTLVKAKETLNSMNFDNDNLSEENMLNYLAVIESNYSLIDKYLTSLEKTLNNSIISV